MEPVVYTGQRIRAGLRLAKSFRNGEFRADPEGIVVHEQDLKTLFDCDQHELCGIFSILNVDQLRQEIEAELGTLMDRYLENLDHARMSAC